jgi:hypothetical protein
MKFERQDRPVADAEIRTFENELGTRLPEDYRQFLLRHAGGHAPEPGYIDVPGWDATVLQAFFGLEDGSPYRLDADGFGNLSVGSSRRLLQIAEDPNGQAFVLDLRLATFGHVYVHDHDGPPNETVVIDTAGFDQDDIEEAVFFHVVANSFDGFLGMLRYEK